MKTETITLKKAVKAMMFVMLLCVAGMTKGVKAQPLIEWELEQPYLFYLVYDDIQARSSSMVTGGNPIRDEQLPHIIQGIGCWHHDPSSEAHDSNCPCEVTQGWLCLAKNEMEGFQVFYREQDISRNLIVEVSDFVNVATNDTLPHTLYYEEFFYAVPYGEGANAFSVPDSLAEALVPYSGEVKVTQPGFNKMFYVELHSRKDQSPGNYISMVTLFDGNDTLASKLVTARVWDFVLPENHYAEVVMGLYNRNSGYNTTNTFLTLNGIQVDDNGNVAPEDLEEAKRILNGYQNCLLEHGVSTYEIPRWLMEDDPKAAELTMADPRRKVFTVPVLYDDLDNSGSDFKPSAQQVLLKYKNMVYDNPFLKDKAFFYPYDEPENATDFAAIDQFCSVLSDYWPGYHATVPFYSDYASTIEHFEGKIDILCPIRGFFNPGVDFANAPIAEERLQDYMTRPHKWWYPDNAKTGGVDFFVYNTASVGIMRRILFWQQYMVHGQGLLYWNCAFLPQDWQKKQLPPERAGGMVHGNGDGILLYPGTMFGQDAATPVVSLRLKQLAAGIDDYDYLCLAKEFLGETMVNARLSSIFYRRGRYANYLCSIMSKEYVNEQGIGEEVFISYSCHQMQIDRAWYMGQQLSQANTEHDWGEWQTAVLPDATHNGLEIRTCSHCGAQESHETIAQFSTQEITLAAGLNWFSTGLDITLGQLETVLTEALPDATSITIKSQTQSTSYNGTTWRGTLNTIDVSLMYEIYVPESCTITLTGLPINPSEHPITIVANGITRIGFPFSESITLEEAFGTIPIDGDVIKSKEGSATYNGIQWRGTFNLLEPGQGYMYKSNDQVDRIFSYPINRK